MWKAAVCKQNQPEKLNSTNGEEEESSPVHTLDTQKWHEFYMALIQVNKNFLGFTDLFSWTQKSKFIHDH